MNASAHWRALTSTALGITLLLQGSLSWADDTEIFSHQAVSGVKPNVFFILDDSGSMKYCLDTQKRCKTGPQRIEILQKTMRDLINNTKDINIGLMTFHRRQSLPMGDIEQVRSAALARVDSLKPSGKTPLAEAFYDAARYFTDLPGKHNSTAALKQNAPNPITEECQPSHFVLLTDGQANRNKVIKQIEKHIDAGANCAVRGTSGIKGGKKRLDSETCVVELADWMNNTDQSTLNDKQTITTHTIGYALEADSKNKDHIKEFLKDIAIAGGGQNFSADNADELSKAFSEILVQAKQTTNTVFSTPGIAGSGFKSTEDKNQNYYSMFRPLNRDSWPGNFKRYGLEARANDALVEIDVNGKDSRNAKGDFNEDAQSWWSTGADGNDVKKGGAAWQLPEPNQRSLWVSIGDKLEPFPTAQTNGSTISISGSSITASLLGAANDDERKALLRYIRGFEEDGQSARFSMNDPLHSAPKLFTYECQGTFNPATAQCNEPYNKENTSQVAIVGTNEGFVHLFDTTSGIELFAFMPDELLKNIKTLRDNAPSSGKPHAYGMDNTVTVWVNDANNNGKVDGSDKVYAYATMRRGGRSIYALDITDKSNPKLQWKITGGTTQGFERLGQTWSRPVKTKINVDGQVTDVLVFGGGYDTDQDEPNNYRKPVSQGHDIYIVNAETGAKIWSASSLNLEAMKYSIPGAVRVLSLDNREGLATQLFVGDTGGQIWRLFIHNGNPAGSLVSAGGANNSGVFADLGGGSGHSADARRFYHEPDVALERNKSGNKLIVNIGSGYRAHPLDTTVKDRMYSLQTSLTVSGKTLREEDLVALGDAFDGEKVAADIAAGKNGWRLELQTPGQKIISTPKTVDGALFFTSYIPPSARSSSSNNCLADTGSVHKQSLRLSDATPFAVPEGSKGSYQTYVALSNHQGLPVDTGIVCFDGKCWVQEAPGEFSDPFSGQAGLGRKGYWIDLAP